MLTKIDHYRFSEVRDNYMPILSQWTIEYKCEELYNGFNPLTFCNIELSYLEPVN